MLETTINGGNININILSPDISEQGFVEKMLSSSFDLHSTVPKRVTENTTTLIGLIWRKCIDRIFYRVFDFGISHPHVNFPFPHFAHLPKQ